MSAVFSCFGVMQGRLLKKYQGRYQAHPLGYWEDEFPIAKELGLDCVEFILDHNDYQDNPLMSEEGVRKIKEISEKTGVFVKTVCADYFMEAPIHDPSDEIAKHSMQVLNTLIDNCAKLGIVEVVIPSVDSSSFLNNQVGEEKFIKNLRPAIEKAMKYDIHLSLETDLPPKQFKDLLEKIDSSCVKVNYDTGNSAALGYDVKEEFIAYGKQISTIHIKDRPRDGGSVFIGEGDTDFDTILNELDRVDYKGPCIMQVYRDDEGVEVFKKQLEWIKPLTYDRIKS